MIQLRVICVLLLLASLGAIAPARDRATEQSPELFTAYLHLSLVQQIPRHADSLAEKASPSAQAEVAAVVKDWSNHQIRRLRDNLEKHFSENARARFESFVATYTTAESRQDSEYLRNLTEQLGLHLAPPQNYGKLRKQAIETHLQPELRSSSILLGEIESWIESQAENSRTPGLMDWIRGQRPQAVAASQNEVPAEPPEVEKDPLRAQEAVMEPMPATDVEVANPMETFTSLTKSERERKLKESQAGMRQVAAERKAYEDEVASKKLADARAEADAMQRQAERLAKVEEEAFNQRQRSFSARLKRILGTALGSVGSGVMGGVGARAGQELANEIFPPE